MENSFVERDENQQERMASAMDGLMASVVLPSYADPDKADFSDDEDGETKSLLDDEMPARLPDPHGVAFTGAELDALTDTDNAEAVKLAYAGATTAKRALLGSRVINEEMINVFPLIL